MVARSSWFRLAVRPGACAAFLATLLLSGCSWGPYPYKWRQPFDVPLNLKGQEDICLYNLERLLDAKQEWSQETGAGVGSLTPSPEVLAHYYFRRYEYGRRAPCDDDTQNLPVFTPICPSGGRYIIGTIGERPKCSHHGDLLRDYDTRIEVPHTH